MGQLTGCPGEWRIHLNLATPRKRGQRMAPGKWHEMKLGSCSLVKRRFARNPRSFHVAHVAVGFCPFQ